MKRYHPECWFLIIFTIISSLQAFGGIISGRVVDAVTGNPVINARVERIHSGVVVYTDHAGQFSIITDSGGSPGKDFFRFHADHQDLYWESDQSASVQLIDLSGRILVQQKIQSLSYGSISMQAFPDGSYFLSVHSSRHNLSWKLLKAGGEIVHSSPREASLKSGTSDILEMMDSLIITASGYFDQKYAFPNSGGEYSLLKEKYVSVDFMNSLIRFEAFQMLQSVPFLPAFGDVQSVKFIYAIPTKTLYYTNSSRYLIHYYFARDILGYTKGHYMFNFEQYAQNPNRIYYLGSLNHFKSSDIYTIDFFSGDEISCEGIAEVYNKIKETSYIGDRLRFFAGAPKWENCTEIPMIGTEEIYQGQNYQPLNPGENFGFLRKIDINQMAGEYLGRHDIVLTNGIPNDLPVTAGIITTEFQTPLSHINVLSHNRGTPNMALRDGWTNPVFANYENALVYLRVTLDSFFIRAASLSEAQSFWAKKEPVKTQNLALDSITTGLIDLSKAGVNSVATLGGKASNFAELKKIKAGGLPIPVPEGSFAIPVIWYLAHIKKYGLDHYIANLLQNPTFGTDMNFRKAALQKMQDSIVKSPIDSELLTLVKLEIQKNPFSHIRFRSSTNAEDIEGFNGAGLYDSFTAIPGDPKKTVERAILRVWASLWNLRAFEEREYFKINHLTVAMAVLVHRSFPSELANGVAITKNLYNEYNPAVTINVQVGEMSIVSPEGNFLPDAILYYLYSDQFEDTYQYISHSTVPGMDEKTIMTPDELKTLKEYCMAIHYHYCALNLQCKPMDIEFKVDVVDGQRKIYIKQARYY